MVLDIDPTDDNLYEEVLKSNQMTDDVQTQPVVAATAVQWRARNACLVKFRCVDADSAAVLWCEVKPGAGCGVNFESLELHHSCV